MRLWSIHPRYLDNRGLLALWREGLLAKAVLEGRTKGYRNHPQLERFRKSAHPLPLLNSYLSHVLREASDRGMHLDGSKIGNSRSSERIHVTSGQVRYETGHLRKKLMKRFPGKAEALPKRAIEPNPVFLARRGGIEPWERA